MNKIKQHNKLYYTLNRDATFVENNCIEGCALKKMLFDKQTIKSPQTLDLPASKLPPPIN